jgi:hypothetical protein
MGEKLVPRVPGDSHLPKERIVFKNGYWLLSEMGILDVLSEPGKPKIFVEDKDYPEGHLIELDAASFVSNLFHVAEGQTSKVINMPTDTRIKERFKYLSEFFGNSRAETKNKQFVYLWQEPLLRLLILLDYSRQEICTAILEIFPEDQQVSEDFKLSFNRAAGYAWKTNPDNVKIYSDA